MSVRVDELLRGNTPSDAWLAGEEARALLSDPDTRTSLYSAMHPRADVAHASLLRALLALAFLDRFPDPEAARAAAYIRGCAKAGDFDNLEAWVAHRRAYFGPQ